ncbi:MAG: hypothetical protein GY861_10855 [bacterium]|nr:hypothetical protein [bacterium]
MSNNKLYIPKKLHVGYQEREDTYTKKLAYVIYTDDKGVKRKETSWKGWCRKFLDDQDNTPTEGFVLNKGVGGVRYSWGRNARNEYIRVYDPRGWEFEISIANLMFILQECTSTKGKGLEGEFVYSWDGKELVLLPVGCEEYKQSSEHTSLQAKKVTKKDMKEGKWYTFKDGVSAVYLGRHLSSEVNTYSEVLGKKHHVFRLESGKYRLENGFTKLASVGEVCDDYGEYLENFLNSAEANPVVDLRWEDVEVVSKVNGAHYLKSETGAVFAVCLSSETPSHRYSWGRYREFYGELSLENLEPITTKGEYFKSKGYLYYSYKKYFYYKDTMNLVQPVFILANGKEKR